MPVRDEDGKVTGPGEFRERLDERRESLLADIRREVDKYEGQQFTDIIQESGGDAGDRSLADLLMDLNLAEITRDVTELREVDAALDRIRRGTYGQCEACGTDIDPERLRALPQARYCLECQERRERGEETPTL